MFNNSDSKAEILLKVLRFQELLNNRNGWRRIFALCEHLRACRT